MKNILSNYNRTNSWLSQSVLVCLIAGTANFSVWGTAEAGQATSLNLPDIPLFVSLNAVPNIFIEMDDSGSMDWTILTPSHFTTCGYDASRDCGTVSTNGTFYDYTNDDDDFANFEYVFSADDDAYSTGCSNNREVMELCDDRGEDDFDWRAKSADLNVLYYNPTTEYKPWPGYPDASFTSARSYPDSELDGYYDTRDMAGFVYHFWIDDHGFSGTQPNHTDRTVGENSIVDQWDTHVKVTVNSGGFSCDLVTYNPTSSSINQTLTSIASDDIRCLAALGTANGGVNLQTNVANWYQHYRRRTMVARAGVSTVISDLPSFRYGFGMINNQDLFVEMPAAATTVFDTHNDALVEEFLTHQQGAYGTPLRRGLERVGKYYDNELDGKPSPIVETCQKNFSVLFSDGYWNGSNPSLSTDVDEDAATINDRSVTLADVAKHYYDEDLSPLANVVPTDPFDLADWQHMVTFTIGFGVTGDLSDSNGNGWPNPELASDNKWYLADSTNEARSVDDLWHAAFNSRGKYISAKRPEDLINGLRAAINNISNRIGSAASGSANGGSISSNSKIFQAKFDSSDWHGELLALNVDPTSGVLGEVDWEAGNFLDARSPSSRTILTTNESGNGTNFTWASLGDNQKDLLDINPQSGESDGMGEYRLLYLRGVQDDEEGNESGREIFRKRAHILGDLGHSDPAYVGVPPFYYQFDNYATFASDKKDRQAAVYVGSNGGMLHAFAEDTGEELFSFVPGYLINKLNKLTDPAYQHEFYVDGSPAYGDVIINSSWKSVLVGSMRSGGQSVYALDITDPATMASSDVLWEFSDKDDADMGYVYGKPQIKQMQNGKWAAIFTSGYDNSQIDLNQSSTGNAYIFILFIEDGLDGWDSGDYIKIPIPGADGLAEPAVADVDTDSKADFIYVGDLSGQMWKIDVTKSTPANWAVAFSGEPLFTATTSAGVVQPITTRPAIKRHPLGIKEGVLVLFGSGRYLELSDDSTVGVPTQSVYSIWDRDGYFNGANDPSLNNSYGAHGFDRTSQLQQPSMTEDADTGTRLIDSTDSTAPIWFNADGTAKDRGWVLDMPVQGERVVREIILRDDIAYFVTLIPNDDICSAGGSGWLMAVNATSGAALHFPVFDIDGDDLVTSADVVGSEVPDSNPLNPAGVSSLSIPNVPAFVFDDRPVDLSGDPLAVFPPTANTTRGCSNNDARSYTYTTQTNGSVTMVTTAAQPLSCGRQSWKQTR